MRRERDVTVDHPDLRRVAQCRLCAETRSAHPSLCWSVVLSLSREQCCETAAVAEAIESSLESVRCAAKRSLPFIDLRLGCTQAWLVAACRGGGAEMVRAWDVMRRGPKPVCHRNDMLAALEELVAAGRVRLEYDSRTIRVNPALLMD